MTNMLTPIERHGDIWLKRDDLFSKAGVNGGKVRSCWHLAQQAKGLVTAGSRSSPQINIVAHVAKELGIPARAHAPTGHLGPELQSAQAAGCEIIQHRPGYNTVIVKRAHDDAEELGWTNIPFGMECQEAVQQTESQVKELPPGVKRIVVPVGSGMSLAGVLQGVMGAIPVVGICVGAVPDRRLDRFAPLGWWMDCQLFYSPYKYEDPVKESINGIVLDPIYEAKCKEFLKPDDLFWIVGKREYAG